MKSAIIDSNVFIASLAKNDPKHRRAMQIMHEIESGETVGFLPRLVPVEVCGALARVIGKEVAVKSRELLALWKKGRKIRLFDLDKSQQELAEGIAIENRLKGADAIIIALKRSFDVDLVTFDKELAEVS